MTFQDLLFGKTLRTDQEGDEQVGIGQGIPIFGLDALSSAAYGPEAAMTLLIPLAQTGTQLLVIRLITGIGLGFAISAPFPIAAELMPAQHRRTYGAIYEIMLASTVHSGVISICRSASKP